MLLDDEVSMFSDFLAVFPVDEAISKFCDYVVRLLPSLDIDCTPNAFLRRPESSYEIK